MRPSNAAVLAVVVIGASFGCDGKGSSAPSAATTQAQASGPVARRTPVPPPFVEPDPTDSQSGKLKVEVMKAKVTINGTAVPIPTELAVLEKAFGKPSGTIDHPTDDKMRRVYWGGLGVMADQDKGGKQEIRDLSFTFGPFYDLSVKAMGKSFAGDFLLEGQPVTKATSPDELAKTVSILRKGSGNWWQIDYDDFALQVTVTPAEKGITSISVQQPSSKR